MFWRKDLFVLLLASKKLSALTRSPLPSAGVGGLVAISCHQGHATRRESGFRAQRSPLSVSGLLCLDSAGTGGTPSLACPLAWRPEADPGDKKIPWRDLGVIPLPCALPSDTTIIYNYAAAAIIHSNIHHHLIYQVASIYHVFSIKKNMISLGCGMAAGSKNPLNFREVQDVAFALPDGKKLLKVRI